MEFLYCYCIIFCFRFVNLSSVIPFHFYEQTVFEWSFLLFAFICFEVATFTFFFFLITFISQVNRHQLLCQRQCLNATSLLLCPSSFVSLELWSFCNFISISRLLQKTTFNSRHRFTRAEWRHEREKRASNSLLEHLLIRSDAPLEGLQDAYTQSLSSITFTILSLPSGAHHHRHHHQHLHNSTNPRQRHQTNWKCCIGYRTLPAVKVPS